MTGYCEHGIAVPASLWTCAGCATERLDRRHAYYDKDRPRPAGEKTYRFTDDGRCFTCGAEVDHYLGCPDDPDPDYEAEADRDARAAKAGTP